MKSICYIITICHHLILQVSCTNEKPSYSKYPFIVSVRADGVGHICTGSLVGLQWVLTSAHCVLDYEKTSDKVNVMAGEPNSADEQMRLVEKIYCHNKFRSDSLFNDVALIQLDQPFREKETVKTNYVPKYTIIIDMKTLCNTVEVIGLERSNITDRMNVTRPDLVVYNHEVLSNKNCARKRKFPVLKHTFCGYAKNMTACLRDTGGPAICEGLIYGIIFYGCPWDQSPSYFTRVDRYLVFIERIMGKDAPYRITKRSLGGTMKKEFDVLCYYVMALPILIYMLLSLFILLNLLKTIKCDEERPKILRKIIGGQDCSTEKYPFVVSIRTTTRMKHFCGGTLIKPDWVLTAAHCITTTNPKYYTVVAGTSETNKQGIQRRHAKKIYKHGKFKENNFLNDIALIELKEGFNMNSTLVGLIGLPPFVNDGDVKDYCREGTVIGWGHREAWDPEKAPLNYVFNPILQCVKIPVLSDDECAEMRGKVLKSTIFCAYAKGGDKDSCQGDSGGPLFCCNTQYGIVSSGYGCAQLNSPGYYTRVDGQLDFIRHVIMNKKLPKFALVDESGGKNIIVSLFTFSFVIALNVIKYAL
ncbi:transmembrane protease serine 9-like [Coccinella septempunctata]|uniref:transmembrane protease serine 9-like n=1 Tax=Coccinella septempunctata TaxID=41139 RepID=UPI001D06C61B|nr:transmembrane protease serine 9-like [Coccinella septempunctata]